MQHYGCAVLCNGTFETRDGQRALMEAGGLQAVLRAISSHTSHAGVLHAGCGVLCNLAQDPLKRRELTEAGSLACIIAGMWAFTGAGPGMRHPEVQEWGINTILAMCTRNPSGLALLQKHDPELKVVEQACKFHWTNPAVTSAGGRLKDLLGASKSFIKSAV